MYKISKLKNNLTLITVPLKGTKATTVLVMVPVGSRYEHKKISGASHFVEHLMFKGTTKRPTAQDISRILDATGAEYNAFTGKDYTGYYVKIDGAKQAVAFDLIADMLFNSKLDAEEIEKEKGVIVEELRMYEDNPTMGIGFLYEKLLFGDCPLGRDEGGDESSVRGISRQELWNYYQSAYKTSNMVLVVAGNIDKKLKKHLQYFLNTDATKNKIQSTITKNNFEKFVWPKEKKSLAHRVQVKEKKLDQAHLIVGFHGLHLNHPDRYILSVLLNILGGGMSSRLFVQVREKRGLAYMIRTGASNYRDVGTAYVQAGLDVARLPEAIKVIKEELEKISTELVSVKELKDAKSNISGRMTLGMEDCSAQAEWFAKQFWLADKMQTYEQVLQKINKVTAADVKRVAKKIFNWGDVHVAAIGQIKKDVLIKVLK
jgi:predicted Zn-dependent peptidase